MTDEQIIKALEYCKNQGFLSKCCECRYKNSSGCVEYLITDALDLINRLQADKEALIAGQETLQKALAEKNEEFKNQSQNFAVLVSDHRILQQSFDNLKGLYEAEKAKVAKEKEKCIGFAKELQTAKAELKETTEKFNCQQTVYADLSDIIKEKNAEIEKLKSRVERFKKYDERRDIELHARLTAEAKTEGRKELAEQLKAKAFQIYNGFEANEDRYIKVVDVKTIDNLVKEMVGDAE